MTVGYPAEEVDNMSKLRYAIAVNINNLHMYVHSDVTLHQTSRDGSLKVTLYHSLTLFLVGSKDSIKYRRVVVNTICSLLNCIKKI